MTPHEWAAVLSLQILDSRALLRIADEEVAGRAARLLEPFIVAEPTGPPQLTLDLVQDPNTNLVQSFQDGKLLSGASLWAVPFGTAMTVLNRMAIEDYRGFALHSGVVARDGRAIAFPAESGGGKSTLTAACVIAGLDYVSDESLCVEIVNAAVVPYPKPLGLSAWSREQLGVVDDALPFPSGGGEAMATAGDLGGEIAAEPIELAHVVIASYGSGETTLVEQSAQSAMAALLEHSFNQHKHGERAFTLAAQLANGTRAWRLDYGIPLEAGIVLAEELA